MADSRINADYAVELPSYNIREHHVYREVWTLYVGELSVKKETENRHDAFAVAMEKDGEVVGHLPQCTSRNISYFLSHSGNSATCTVTGQQMNRGVGLGVKVPWTNCLLKDLKNCCIIKSDDHYMQ